MEIGSASTYPPIATKSTFITSSSKEKTTDQPGLADRQNVGDFGFSKNASASTGPTTQKTSVIIATTHGLLVGVSLRISVGSAVSIILHTLRRPVDDPEPVAELSLLVSCGGL